jgi:hypothetical protein
MMQRYAVFVFVAHGRECVGGTINNVKLGFVCGVLRTSECGAARGESGAVCGASLAGSVVACTGGAAAATAGG